MRWVIGMDDAGVALRVLGPFQVCKWGRPIPLRSGGKAEKLLSSLAIRHRCGIGREALIETIWPDSPPELSTQCLNTLIHGLKTQFADALAGQAPVVHQHGHYVLNLDGGLKVDSLEFESAVDTGHRLLSTGATEAAIEAYERAVNFYRGDLSSESGIAGLLERERLRTVCLATLARLADAHFELANYEQALAYAARLLEVDPCREDAHRMTMRACVRMGARSQALRQYSVCRRLLADEFDAVPEPATEQLFAVIRTDPGAI
ncbi:hypothetical protein A5731_09835 [Mycolicibacterium conceptionense]|uniref:Bacterial transcriptional activator domain-containing protein n=2 Tax=Mycolicibacterium TaxID=1866885 RepID=A0A1A1ZT60_9MYCO|nr:hypothetical protein A5718_11400 [Mycolicibacterium conceptionense]OBF05970.1 hypothetical protein A5731_09835 [Mycolicibacterium conceptionense]OBF27252.1 hypothetical protein A5726_03985 [Mycolicibacterium conceptionense]OBF46634.1 hypothetical protein A5720_06700 [Mycolicibacterium conceptionense]OBI01553.1 hypothetical protein A5716_04570 [Mycolicibacterium conceptionense]